ncbi:MAG: hypothetical protein ACO35C_03845 [Pontimonas sp.]
MTNVYEKILVLDSSTRDLDMYPSSNDYAIEIPRITGVCGVDILDANIPLTQEPVSDRNNQFTYSVGTGAPRTLSIDAGTYTASSLVTALQALLTADGQGLTSTLTGRRVAFGHSTDEFKIFLNRENSVHRLLGIKSSAPYIQSSARAYTPSGMIDTTGDARYIMVQSNASIDESVKDTCEPGLGVYMVPAYGASSDRARPWTQYPTRFFATPKTLQHIGITLRNPDGSLYETHGLDHVFVCRVWKLKPSAASSTRSPAPRSG